MKKATKFFKALANNRRLEILKLLKNQKGALTVSEISQRIILSFKSTSKHLLILEGVDLVKRQQEGLEVFYSLNPIVAQGPLSLVDLQ